MTSAQGPGSTPLKKTYLLTPGPTPVPEKIHAKFAEPLIHHRTPEFQKLFEEIRKGLKYLFQTQNEVLTLATSGTGAMDAAVCNLFSPGDEVITINGGKFGARWAQIGKAYGLRPIEIEVARGHAFSPNLLREAWQKNPNAKAVLFQASETSTGALMPTREIVSVSHEMGGIAVCDAITACGVLPLPMDEWGIDVLITGSQKALMIPPGLSFIALNSKAWEYAAASKCPKFYLNLAKEKKAQEKNQTAWSPATSLMQGLSVALQMIQEEGLPQIFARHELLARATRAGVQAMGLEILAAECPSPAVTSVRVPSQISDGKKLVRLMRDRWGVTIAGGQDELEGKIFRLSHFGYCGPFDITTGLSALELALNELGFQVSWGKGVGAAMKILYEGQVK